MLIIKPLLMYFLGYLSDEDYMTKFNPPEQFIATANNLNQDPNKPCVNTYPALPTRVNRQVFRNGSIILGELWAHSHVLTPLMLLLT